MRVAVVIPCYNDHQFLPEAIACIEAEEPSELVVVDDGSQDPGTLQLLDELSRRGVRVIHQQNAGPSAARMAGVAVTTAPYVLPLDSDDLLGSGAIKALADALDQDPGAGVAWGDLELFRPTGERVRARGPETLDPWLITYVNELPLAAMFRREWLERTGGFRIREGYEDWDHWMALAELGCRGVHLNRVVERHREHGSRRWSQDFAKHERALTVLRERHAALFKARPQNFRDSNAPWRQKLLLPAIERASFLSPANQYRLAHLVSHPLRFARVQMRRLGSVRALWRPRTTRTAS